MQGKQSRNNSNCPKRKIGNGYQSLTGRFWKPVTEGNPGSSDIKRLRVDGKLSNNLAVIKEVFST